MTACHRHFSGLICQLRKTLLVCCTLLLRTKNLWYIMKLALISDNSGISSQISSRKQKTTVYRLLVWSFSLASITDVVSIFRRQQRYFPLFLLVAAKSALSILWSDRTFGFRLWSELQIAHTVGCCVCVCVGVMTWQRYRQTYTQTHRHTARQVLAVGVRSSWKRRCCNPPHVRLCLSVTP